MAMSGVKVEEDVITTYNEMKKIDSKTSRRKCLILRLSEDRKSVVVDDKQGTINAYDGLLTLFRGDLRTSPRYVVFDYTFQTKTNVENNKLVLITWIPDESPIKDKMVYASTKDEVKKKLDGIGKYVQATDLDEVSEEKILELVQ